MDRNYLFTYIVPLIGAFVLAAGIGGAVLGSYAPVQGTFGLCGSPEMTVFGPGEASRITTSGGFEFPEFAYEELSDPAREAFDGALASPLNEHGVEGDLPPGEREAFSTGLPAFEGSQYGAGAVVIYEGAKYFVTTTPHPCVRVAPLLLPASLLALLVGGIGMLTPIAWRRQVGRPLHGGDTGNVRDALTLFRDGPYEGVGLVGAFGAASVVGLVPFIGPVLGGSLVGAVAPTAKRAAVLGTYLGALLTGILAASTAFGVLPDTLAILARLLVAVVPSITPSLLAVTAVVVVAPLVLAPVSAVATRFGTRSF